MTEDSATHAEVEEVQNKLTMTEIGIIISCVVSLGTLIFTGGFVYGQVQQNKSDIAELRPKVDDMRSRLERVDANVTFLTDMAREDRRK